MIQFVYTCVQDHLVWQSQQFWEEAFYSDVEAQIKQLYVDEEAPKANAEDASDTGELRLSHSSMTPLTKHRSFTSSRTNLTSTLKESSSATDVQHSSRATQKPVPSALSIAAKQVCWNNSFIYRCCAVQLKLNFVLLKQE